MRFSLLAVAAGLLALPLAARADLLGDSIDVSVLYPNSTTTFADLGDYTVPGAGSDSGVASFVINPTLILISAESDESFLPSDFNGLEFQDITQDPGITSVTVDPLSNVMGAQISFTSNAVFANFSGVTVNAGDTLILDLNFAPAAAVTPEPASIALLGTGLLGIAGTMRRRFVRL